LKRKGCCGKYIGSNYGLFASNKSCLKSDKNSEKKILEILQQDAEEKLFQENTEEHSEKEVDLLIGKLTNRLEEEDDYCENCAGDVICEEISNAASPLFKTTLIICICTAVGLLGVVALLLYNRSKNQEDSEKGRTSHIMATSGTLGAVGVLSVYANDSRKDEEKTLTDI